MLVGDIYGGTDYKKVYNVLDFSLLVQDEEIYISVCHFRGFINFKIGKAPHISLFLSTSQVY